MNHIGGAVAFVAGYSPTSSGFQNACGALRSKGLVVYKGKQIVLTDAGRSIVELPTGISSNEDLHAKILEKLAGPERKILEALIAHYHVGASEKSYIAEFAGYSPTSSGFQNACGKLRTLGLVEYPERGLIIASSILFPL